MQLTIVQGISCECRLLLNFQEQLLRRLNTQNINGQKSTQNDYGSFKYNFIEICFPGAKKTKLPRLQFRKLPLDGAFSNLVPKLTATWSFTTKFHYQVPLKFQILLTQNLNGQKSSQNDSSSFKYNFIEICVSRDEKNQTSSALVPKSTTRWRFLKFSSKTCC